jgi:hypothetical protein
VYVVVESQAQTPSTFTEDKYPEVDVGVQVTDVAVPLTTFPHVTVELVSNKNSVSKESSIKSVERSVEPKTAEISTYPSYATVELWNATVMLEIAAWEITGVASILLVDSSTW